MRSDSTTLTIAHRLATVRRADWIIVLSSDGTVAEQGTYAQLTRKRDGAFNRLMKMQLEGAMEAPQPCQNGVIYEEAEMEEKEEQEMKEEEEARLEEEKKLEKQKQKRRDGP